MKIEELKQNDMYEFECNMTEEYKNYNVHDEWGCAFVWFGEIVGAEYNFCVDADYKTEEFYTACAIYKTVFNKETEYMETDYDTFIHYDIDFNNDNWKKELEDAMCNALIKFHNL